VLDDEDAGAGEDGRGDVGVHQQVGGDAAGAADDGGRIAGHGQAVLPPRGRARASLAAPLRPVEEEDGIDIHQDVEPHDAGEVGVRRRCKVCGRARKAEAHLREAFLEAFQLGVPVVLVVLGRVHVLHYPAEEQVGENDKVGQVARSV